MSGMTGMRAWQNPRRSGLHTHRTGRENTRSNIFVPAGVSCRRMCSQVTIGCSVLNVKVVRWRKLCAGPMPGGKSTMYISAAKVQQQKKPWRALVRMKYAVYQNLNALRPGRGRANLYWIHCMNGWWKKHAVEKIQTGRSVHLCTESVVRTLLLQWWRSGGGRQ